MPTNKNAIIRYMYLDEMLSDRYHYYTIQDLTDRCNAKLEREDLKPVTKRCIEMDLRDLEEQPPFYVELDRFRKDGSNYVRYSEPGFSIFTKALSRDEEAMLSEALSTLGQFEGLPNFAWLDALKKKLGKSKEDRRIISFSENQYLSLARPTILGELFTAIANRQVIDLHYHTFKDESRKSCVLHPYLLKQYNDRWHLIGAAEDGYALNFAIDRIEGFEPMPEKMYCECEEYLEDRFEDIVGVTLPKDSQPEEIVLWVADNYYPYIASKPLHGSQAEITDGGELSILREQNSHLPRGRFLRYECIINHELVNAILAMGHQAVMVMPERFNLLGKDTSMREIVAKMSENYSLRK